jgi:putative methyltransferase (TIGR04325 family)
MIENTLAPIALFIYKRPHLLRRTLESLSSNSLAGKSKLIVFADGPKPDAGREEKNAISQARAVVTEKQWCGEIEIIESTTNSGLSKSIINGVTRITQKYGRCIVLEDDFELSPYFLEYMNSALELYKNDSEVISISAFLFPIRGNLPDTFFLRWADCWGWATWKRWWDLFNPDGKALLKSLKAQGLEKDFDFDNSFPYIKMLKDQIEGKNDSWAIRWYASAMINNKLTLCPGKSLVRHIGNEGSGTHFGNSTWLDVNLSSNAIPVSRIKLGENKKVRRSVISFFKGQRMNWQLKAMDKVAPFVPSRVKNAFRPLLIRYLPQSHKPDAANKTEFVGNYSSWAEARANCTGYDTEVIINKTKAALLKVKRGEAVYERDSVAFDKIEYAWPLLAGLLYAASRHNNVLNVADFGGSLGSTYFQCRAFFDNMREVKWNIIEQAHVVKCGKEYFEDDVIKFYYDIESCWKEQKPHTLLLSGVLQYLESPYDFLARAVAQGFENIIVDRTLLNEGTADRLTVQKVPEYIFTASYPCWFIGKQRLLAQFEKKYMLMAEFPGFQEGHGFIFSAKQTP